MVEEKYIELINREIDRANSQTETRKLREYLARHPEAQKLYNELAGLSVAFSKNNMAEPPVNLKKNILNSIPAGRYGANVKEFKLRNYLKSLNYAKKSRYAYVFSFGMVAGIVMFLLIMGIVLKNDPLKLTNLYGTIGVTTPNPAFVRSENAQIKGLNIKGSAELLRSVNSVMIDLSLNSSEKVDVAVDFDKDAMNFLEFKNSADWKNELKVGNNSLRFTSIGENKYQVILGCRNEATQPIYLKISTPGSTLFEHAFLGGGVERPDR